MYQIKYRRPDLPNRRDSNLIMHVVRNYITMMSVAHSLFFVDKSYDAVRKVFRRLTRNEYLRPYPLAQNRQYFRLGPRAVRRWSYPPSRSDKLGSQRLPYELGALSYTCLDHRPRLRLLPHELRRRLPWFPKSLMQWAYVWEHDGLRSIRVEHRAQPKRTIHKLGQQLFTYRQMPEFAQLIDADNFSFVVVLATAEQELRLREEADRQDFDQSKMHTAHTSELIDFI